MSASTRRQHRVIELDQIGDTVYCFCEKPPDYDGTTNPSSLLSTWIVRSASDPRLAAVSREEAVEMARQKARSLEFSFDYFRLGHLTVDKL